MYDSIAAALFFPQVETAVGLTEACNQLKRLVFDLLVAKAILLSLFPIEVASADLLGNLDFVLINVAVLASFTLSCSEEIIIDVPAVTAALLSIKAAMLSIWSPPFPTLPK
jgi:hypothetical protein